MKCACMFILLALMMALPSCQTLDHEVISKDCTVAAVPTGFTRLYIGVPASNGQQSGTSAKDPLDGTTAVKLDTILSTIADGERPTWGTQTNIPQQNLIVCLASGTFSTNGQYDWVIDNHHSRGSTLGFTAEKNWKIHGMGTGRTTLQLASFVANQFVDLHGAPFIGGSNIVIGTHSANASGIEISDLTIDANHDGLTSPGGLPLNLEGIVLRSDRGGHWIHNVHLTGASGDMGFRNILLEAFALQIWGNSLSMDPQQNTGTIVENVAVIKPGKPVTQDEPAGGATDGIVVNNAVAEIRNNTVDGYAVAYGGWAMGPVWFHDNIAQNVLYGFNADSFDNTGVILEANKIIHPASYGIVIGGGDGTRIFQNWNVINNSIQLNHANSAGLILRGQVRNSTFSGNTISSDGPAENQIAIWSYPLANGMANSGNSFQDNHIDKAMAINFSRDPDFSADCRYLNRDLQGNPRPDFPDNSNNQCK